MAKLSPEGSVDRGAGTDPKPEKEIDDKMEGLKSAAEDIMFAIEQKSPHDLMLALKSFLQLADPDEDEEESSPSDDTPPSV